MKKPILSLLLVMGVPLSSACPSVAQTMSASPTGAAPSSQAMGQVGTPMGRPVGTPMGQLMGTPMGQPMGTPMGSAQGQSQQLPSQNSGSTLGFPTLKAK